MTVRWLVAVVFAAFACRSTPAMSRSASDATAAPTVAPTEFSPFGIPQSGRPLLCHRVDAPLSSPLGTIAYEFEDGRMTVDDRLMRSLYDSTGRPLSIVVMATEKLASGKPWMHALMVNFLAQPYHGFRVLYPESRDDNATEPLPPSTVAQAHDLVVWLWNHRCNRSTSAPL